jgi:N-acyl-D-amino-acid deacylase
MDSSLSARRHAYRDPDWRQRAAKGSDAQTVLVPRWETYVVQEAPSQPEAVGKAIDAIARERGIHPVLALVDLALGEPDLGLVVKCIIANDDPAEVERILKDEGCTLGLSDAGAHVSQLCDASQATDFLGSWVRDRGIMSLEDGVRRLTGLQADILGLGNRGYVRPGMAADVVVFDFATVAPGPVRKATDFPGGAVRLTAPEPKGVRHVFVNGIPIRMDEVQQGDGTFAGQLVRSERRT